MKIRNGFVSNSSSSSFVIYGVEKDVFELFEKLFPNVDPDSDDFEGDECGMIAEKLDELNIPYRQDFDSESFYLGEDWNCIDDNETGEQFKCRIEKLLSDALGESVKCRTIDVEISC